MGNPFNDESKDLLVLDSRDIADSLVVDAMCNLKKTGQEQYNTFVTERLVTQTTNSLSLVGHLHGRSQEQNTSYYPLKMTVHCSPVSIYHARHAMET